MKLKPVATLMLATLLGTTAQAAESLSTGPYLRLKVLGNTGFVLNRLKAEDTKIVTGGEYDYLVVGPNVQVDGNVKKEINDALDQGKRVIFDNQPGQHLASENAALALVMTVEADALMVKKPEKDTGLLITPVDRPTRADALSASKAQSNKQDQASNTIENVFGL
nr:hypothetical protein [uncultured Pseudomonas sp.]